jgi:hypothetical protein
MVKVATACGNLASSNLATEDMEQNFCSCVECRARVVGAVECIKQCNFDPSKGGFSSFCLTIQQYTYTGAWQVVRLAHESSIAILSFAGSCKFSTPAAHRGNPFYYLSESKIEDNSMSRRDLGIVLI